jgi:hypothetical protein
MWCARLGHADSRIFGNAGTKSLDTVGDLDKRTGDTQ